MKFMFFSEGDTLPGDSYQTRYWDLVDEVIHAEKWGFDSFGVSEQQFAIGGVSTSAPEVLYGYLFSLTQRLRFAHAITLLPKNINHALKVACRTAVQDVLSRGRIELGVGRGNTTLALRAYEVDVEKNRSEVVEGIKILKAAFTQVPFMFYGEHYKIPPRSLVPKPIQTPHPPLYTAATSEESHVLAAKLGIGVYTWSSFLGWDMIEKSVSAYRSEIEKTRATGEHVNDEVGALVQGYCAETDEQAREDATEGNLKWVKLAIDGYPRLAKMSKDYSYMAAANGVQDKLDNYLYFKEASGGAIFGSPESCIKAIERFKAIGCTQVVIRIDSIPHHKIMKSIEMFGRYVIPHFKNPRNFMRPAEDVIADIREMREEAKRKGVYVDFDAPKKSKVG